MPNSNCETNKLNGSLPTTASESTLIESKLKAPATALDEQENTNVTAAESFEQPTNSTQVKLYGVSVAADVPMCLQGMVNVYAADSDEAIEKVQAQIDNGLLDDLEMEDVDELIKLPYEVVQQLQLCRLSDRWRGSHRGRR